MFGSIIYQKELGRWLAKIVINGQRYEKTCLSRQFGQRYLKNVLIQHLKQAVA